jgi:hypothetical protein
MESAEGNKMLACGNCGQFHLPDASFCEKCGARLSIPDVATMRRVPAGPLVSGGFAAFTVLASTQTWARVLFVSLSGTDADRGVITLIAALAGLALCAGRIMFGVRDRWYFGLGLVLFVVAFSMPMWFLIDIYTEPPTEFFDTEVRLIDPGFGLFLALIGSAGYGASLCWQLFRKATKRSPSGP